MMHGPAEARRLFDRAGFGLYLALLVGGGAGCDGCGGAEGRSGPDGGPSDASTPMDGGGGGGGADGGGDPMDAGVRMDGGALADGGPSDPDAGPPDLVALCGAEPVTLDDWENCYRKVYCEALLFTTEKPLYADVAECIERLDAVSSGQVDYDARVRRRAIEAGRASIDEAAFAECLRFVRSGIYFHFSADCGRRFTGTVADGETCYADLECASLGATCEAAACGDACCPGTCQPLAALGEPCDDFYACEPGLTCSFTEKKCVEGRAGAPCADSWDCYPGTWCDKSAGVCKAALPEGASCTSLLACGPELMCVGLGLTGDVDPRCGRTSEDGDPCTRYCNGNLYCEGSLPNGTPGACRPLPTHGETCRIDLPCVGKNEACHLGLAECITLPAEDEPCLDGVCRPGLFCSTELDPGDPSPVCVAPLADDAVGCRRAGHCASHLCSGDADTPGTCEAFPATCP